MKQNYSQIVKKQRDFFNSNQTRDIEFRKKYLLKLKEEIIKREIDLYCALEIDLNKNAKESFLAEINQVYDELDLAIKKVKKWSETAKIKNHYTTFGSKNGRQSTPRGITFIISPFNYPVSLSLIPLISSIAAGNTAILKLSELTTGTNNIISKIVEQTFDEEYVSIISKKDLKSFDDIYNENIDFLFFTGSTKIGKIIQQKCVENDIPHILELGGKSPVIIEPGAEDQKHFMERIVWGKLLNAGQTCVAPDYFLVQESSIENFIKNLKGEIQEQYPNVLMNNNIPRIINKTAFSRLMKVLTKYKDKIVWGGGSNEGNLIIEPTIILVDDVTQIEKTKEIFGPIFFVAKYKTFGDAVESTKKIDPNPLAAYLFTTNRSNVNFFIHKIDSLNIGINDMVIQVSNPNVPFGGHKTSGIGKYHGKYGFESFSLQKHIMNKRATKNLPIMFSNKGTNFDKTKSLIQFIKKIIK